VDSADKKLLDAISWNPTQYVNRTVDFKKFEAARTKLLNYLEENGYPFASIRLDSIELAGGALEGRLHVDRGPLYRIDSIRNLGSAKISNTYLQHYLGIPNGSIYRKEKLLAISKKFTELPFLQEQQ